MAFRREIISVRFYILDKPMTTSKFTNYSDSLNDIIGEDCPMCPACRGPVFSLPWLPPHRVVLEQIHNTEFADMVFCPGNATMVSQRFFEAVEKWGLKGITKVYPPAEVVKIIPKKRRHLVPPTYHLVNIALSQTRLDEEASGVFREKGLKCPVCRLGVTKLDRLVIDERTWTDEDVFYAVGMPGRIIVTERFAEMCREEGLRNAVLIPAEKYKEMRCGEYWDEDLGEWTPPDGWPSNIPWPAKWDEEQNKWVPL